MFLNHLTCRVRSDERGSALVAVVGVMAVGLLLTAMIMTSVVGGFGFTTATRAGVQSQAAADGGIAIARAGLEAGTCAARGGVYQSAVGEVPQYRVEIWHPRTVGTGWDRGCPSPGTNVRLVSIGTAASPGVGASGNDRSFVEAVLAQPSTSSIAPSGPAIYAHSSSGFGNSGRLDTVNGSRPSVLIKTGNVGCTGSSSAVAADWVVDGGTLEVGNSCKIGGSVWTTGRTTVPGSGEVSGAVAASGVTVLGSGKIGGSVWSSSDITMGGSAQIFANATGASLSMSNSAVIGRDAWIFGAASLSGSSKVSGTLTASSKSGSGTTGTTNTLSGGPGASPFVAPERPLVPEWTDFDYDRTDWPGFREVVLDDDCDEDDDIQDAINRLGTNPGIIDARRCDETFALGGSDRITVRDDLVIVAKKFRFGNSASFTSSAAKRLWLITPDTVDDNLPTCPRWESHRDSIEMSGSFAFSRNLSVMFYSPCPITQLNSVSFKGQVYAGRTSLDNSSTMGYVPIGLPNVNLSTGEATEPDPAGSPWLPVSIRNLANG